MRRLDEQMDRVDKLDTKIAGVAAITAGLLPLFGAAVALLQSSPPVATSVLYSAGVILYLFLVAANTLAYMTSGWRFDPDLEDLKFNSERYDEVRVRMWVASECVRAIQVNEPRINRKAEWVGRAIALLGGEVLLLSLAAASLLF
jgi:hypothetical protein